MAVLPIESMNEKSEDGDIMFRILMDPQPIVNTQGTDGHGCWECDDGSFAWWGRESDGYHRKHSSPHRCPFGKEGDSVEFADNRGTISSVTIASILENKSPQDVGPRGTYHWCIWVTPNYKELMGASGYGPYDNDTSADCMHDINEELMGYISQTDDADILFCLMDVYFSMPFIHYKSKNTFNKYVPILYKLDENRGWKDEKLRKDTIDQYVEKWKQIVEDWGCKEIDDDE